MAPRTPKKIVLSENSRYALADQLASTYKAIDPNKIDAHRHYYFGQVINGKFSIKGEVTSLAERYDQETAMHVTNLVLSRLSTPALERNIGAIVDIEEEA